MIKVVQPKCVAFHRDIGTASLHSVCVSCAVPLGRLGSPSKPRVYHAPHTNSLAPSPIGLLVASAALQGQCNLTSTDCTGDAVCLAPSLLR